MPKSYFPMLCVPEVADVPVHNIYSKPAMGFVLVTLLVLLLVLVELGVHSGGPPSSPIFRMFV